MLVIFSVGYVAMSRKKTTTGGFYSYISHGLGREIGFGAGFGTLVAYGVFEASLAGGFAYFANLKLASLGLNVGWAPLALGMVVVIGVLTYFDVSFSAKILAVGLVTEVLILLLFDALLLAKGHIYWSALNPVKAFKSFPATRARASPPRGAIGIGLFFAFWSWVGFEMAPNYGEESRDPKKNVGRAHVHLGDRPRRLLHAHLLGLAGRLPVGQLGHRRRRRATRPTSSSPRPPSTPATGSPR